MKRRSFLCLMALITALSAAPVMASPVDNTLAEDGWTDGWTAAGDGEGDDLDIVEASDTHNTTETPCQLTVKTTVPDGFGLSTYVILTDDDGNNYRVSMLDDNDYVGTIFLAAGHYRITDVAVYDDMRGDYPFEITTDEINMAPGDVDALDFKLSEYDLIDKQIKIKTGELPADETLQDIDIVDDIKLIPTGVPGISFLNSKDVCYEVTHEGSGAGTVTVTGHATTDIDLLVRVVRAGITGEAVCEISADGGATSIGQTTITSDGVAIGGISIDFKTPDLMTAWLEGDIYRAAVREIFTPTSDAKEANLIALGHPLEDHSFVIKILSDGKRGTAKYAISMDGGTTLDIEPTQIPADGVLSMDDGLTVYFSDAEYSADTLYNFTIESNDGTVDYTPLYILAGVVILLVIIIIAFFASKKETQNDYEMTEYEGKSDPQKYV